MAEASDEYKAHVKALLAPVYGEIAELRAAMERLSAEETASAEAG